jgi:hypothetical protein
MVEPNAPQSSLIFIPINETTLPGRILHGDRRIHLRLR